MRALVTGAGGVIGAELARQLAAGGAEVIGADLRPLPPALLAAGIAGRVLDVSVAGEVMAALQEIRPDVVFHFAALLTGMAEQRHLLAFQVNVVGMHNMLQACRVSGMPRFVYASSNGVFGRDLPELIDDYSLQRPDTHYGCAKLLGENLGRWYFDKFGLDFRTVRYPMIVEPGDRARYHWIPPMIEDALAGRAHVCTEAVPESSACIVSVADAARAAIDLAAAPAAPLRTRCYTVLGFAEPVTAAGLAAQLQGIFPEFAVSFPKQARRTPKQRRFSDHYARAEWGWQPRQTDLPSLLDEFRTRLARIA